MKGMLFNIQRFTLHDGPGIRTAIFFKGCSLRCKWCSNPESQNPEPEMMGGALIGRLYTVEEVVLEALKDKAFYGESGGVTLTGGDPMMQPNFACTLIDALARENIRSGIETAGWASSSDFLRVARKAAFVYIDLKHHNEASHREGTSIPLSPILDNLRLAIRSGLPVTPRIPVIPSFNDSLADAEAFGRLLSDLGAKVVHLLPFHQMGQSKYVKLFRPYDYSDIKQLHEEDLTDYAKHLESYGLEIQIGG